MCSMGGWPWFGSFTRWLPWGWQWQIDEMLVRGVVLDSFVLAHLATGRAVSHPTGFRPLGGD